MAGTDVDSGDSITYAITSNVDQKSYSLKFCPDEFSVTSGRILLKFGEKVDMNVNLCNSVSKSKILDSKAVPQSKYPTQRLAHRRAQNCQNYIWPISH